MMTVMKIALDFDGTYTRDPDFWQHFIRRSDHHKIHIVTLRNADLDRIKDHDWFERWGVEVIYCNGLPKQAEAERQGHKFDIWIDDDPRSILEGSKMNDEQLAKWRERDVHR